jgi:Rhodanese-related sulfurtransferase
MNDMTVQVLQQKRDSQDLFVLLDVREPDEVAIAKISGATYIPMGDILARHTELNPEDEIIVMCHSGIRSFQVMRLLQELGFAKVKNLKGGINAWSTEIDPTIKRY